MDQFVTQPYLLSLEPACRMHILWIQRDGSPGTVEYGPTPALGRRLSAPCREVTGLRAPATPEGYSSIVEENPLISFWQCTATLDNLAPGETVYYRCLSAGEATPIYSFHTAPPAGSPYRFAQISDLQGFNPCDRTVHKIGCMQPDFLLYSGDAIYYSWRADQWFGIPEFCPDPEARSRAFFPCMQQENGARLMQYCPTFFCPGNHEVDDLRVGYEKGWASEDKNWTWHIMMQLFHPLYPDPDCTLSGRRWYSADYADLHITSLHIQRWGLWGAYEAPGWRLVDSIEPGSPQRLWLEQDLKQAQTKFKWVIQHWHLLNKGTDTQNHLCTPVIDETGAVSYPLDNGQDLMDLYQRYGVNAVTYGHSHVYERYFAQDCHYIEAAYLGCCCRESNAPLHPSGLIPLVEDNSQQSFLILDRRAGGLYATGYYAQDPPVPFDAYQIADEAGNPVPPRKEYEP